MGDQNGLVRNRGNSGNAYQIISLVRVGPKAANYLARKVYAIELSNACLAALGVCHFELLIFLRISARF